MITRDMSFLVSGEKRGRVLLSEAVTEAPDRMEQGQGWEHPRELTDRPRVRGLSGDLPGERDGWWPPRSE